ncbi:hypothetical protein BZG17_30845 [Escherichia coli]|nr:hypothetical protein [Escherichia coli]
MVESVKLDTDPDTVAMVLYAPEAMSQRRISCCVIGEAVELLPLVQDTTCRVSEERVTVAFDGAAGGSGGVCTVFEYAQEDTPLLLRARTRYW